METYEIDLTRDWTILAEGRLAVYRFLLAALDKPTPAQHAWLESPAFRHALEQVCERFDLAVPPSSLAAADPADHEARYIACFDVGMPTAPVVLLASHYNRREPVTAIIHEHLLFYHRFGANLTTGNGEPADHALNEMAFLIHLDELLLAGQIEKESILRARHDFLGRHMSRWPTGALAAAKENEIPPLYVVLLGLLAAAVEQDRALTEAELHRLVKE
jgi:TorA maturation chaperone TorD